MVQKGRSAESGTEVSFLSGKGDDREPHTELQEQSGTVVLKPIWLESTAKAGKGRHPR